MFKTLFVAVLFFLLSVIVCARAFAQANHALTNEGLKGQELTAVAVSAINENIVFAGTKEGLYVRDLSLPGYFRPVPGLPPEKTAVRQIVHGPRQVYAATEKGLFAGSADSRSFGNVWTRAQESERDVKSAAVLEDGTIFAATKSGLFYKPPQEGAWSKAALDFEAEEIVSLYAAAGIIYAAVSSGVYRSIDSAKSWEKIFNVYEHNEVQEDEDREGESAAVSYITGLPQEPSLLYVGVSSGIFTTNDNGGAWEKLPSGGLEPANLKTILINPSDKGVFAAAKAGVFKLEGKEWKHLVMTHDCQAIAPRKNGLIVITANDIFEYPSAAKQQDLTGDDSLARFNHEPSIEETQQMAIAYGNVSDRKIKDWQRRASVRAFMPQLTLDYDKTVTTALGASYDRVQVGPRDWGLSLKWELADLIFNGDQTSIDTRSRLLVQLRNDILAEVTRLYFERRKLQLELASSKTAVPAREEMDKKLRLMELTALLDRLTGTAFSKVLKSNK